jgi:hypothetical protein
LWLASALQRHCSADVQVQQVYEAFIEATSGMSLSWAQTPADEALKDAIGRVPGCTGNSGNWKRPVQTLLEPTTTAQQALNYCDPLIQQLQKAAEPVEDEGRRARDCWRHFANLLVGFCVLKGQAFEAHNPALIRRLVLFWKTETEKFLVDSRMKSIPFKATTVAAVAGLNSCQER